MTTSDRDRWLLGLALALQGSHSPDRVVTEFRARIPEFARRGGVVWLWDPERGVLKTDAGRERVPDDEVTRLLTAGGSTTTGAAVTMGLHAFDRPRAR